MWDRVIRDMGQKLETQHSLVNTVRVFSAPVRGARPASPICNSVACEYEPPPIRVNGKPIPRDPQFAFFCPLCRQWVCWCTGCGDEDPDICDDCWFANQPEAWERRAA